MKFLLTLLSAFYLLLVAPSPSAAQTTSLSLDPPVVEILLAPNKKVVQAVQITNHGEAGQFVAELHAFTPLDNLGHVQIDPAPLDLATIPLVIRLANADKVLGTPFPLYAGETTQLVLELDGASTDVSSDTYFALVISPHALPQELNSTSKPALSSLLLVTLTPDGVLPVNLEIIDFDLPLIHDSSVPLAINANLFNASSVMLRPHGQLEIISPRNSTDLQIPLYPHLVLKDSNRQILASEGSNPPEPLPLIWQPKLRNIGPYRLKLEITTIGGSHITSVEKTVWLLPLRAGLFSLIALIILTTLYIRRHKLLSKTKTQTE